MSLLAPQSSHLPFSLGNFIDNVQLGSAPGQLCHVMIRQMGALHGSGSGMWPGLGSPAQQLCVQGSGLCHLEPVLPLLRQEVTVWWLPGPAHLPAGPQQSVLSHPILLASMGGVRVGSRSRRVSAASQVSSRPWNTSCSLQPPANTSTSSGCRGQAWCCPAPSPATPAWLSSSPAYTGR